MVSRTTKFAILGMSLSSLLDINNLQDFLKAMINLLHEFECILNNNFKPKISSLSRGIFKQSSKSARKSAGGTDYSITLQESGDPSFIYTPNIPFDLDYFEVWITLSDMLVEVYQKMIKFIDLLGGSSASLGTTTGGGSGGPTTGVGGGPTTGVGGGPTPPSAGAAPPLSTTLPGLGAALIAVPLPPTRSSSNYSIVSVHQTYLTSAHIKLVSRIDAKLKTVDRDITAKCLVIMHQANPALLDYMQYYLNHTDASKGKRYRLAKEFGQILLSNCREAVGAAPLHQDVTFPTAPRTTITLKGEIVYEEVDRVGVSRLKGYLDKVQESIQNLYKLVKSQLTIAKSQMAAIRSFYGEVVKPTALSGDKTPLLHLKRKVGSNRLYLDVLTKIASAGTTWASYLFIWSCTNLSLSLLPPASFIHHARENLLLALIGNFPSALWGLSSLDRPLSSLLLAQNIYTGYFIRWSALLFLRTTEFTLQLAVTKIVAALILMLIVGIKGFSAKAGKHSPVILALIKLLCLRTSDLAPALYSGLWAFDSWDSTFPVPYLHNKTE
ncbi:hypothetical protein PtB15_16B348 [Puccinia triticina]|nr:hypothetical protein PtB15_16B348 [Puccinia triticina]